MYNSGSSKIKWFKRLGIYKNSTNTVSFDPETKTGRSYRWNFCQQVGPVVVFNEYRWSVTTSGHQSAVRSVLRERGIQYISLDLGEVEPKNISKITVLGLYGNMFDLEIEIELSTKKESWTQTDRINRLNEMRNDIEKLEKHLPQFKPSQKNIKIEHLKSVEKAFNSLSEKQAEKCFKFLNMAEAKTNLSPIEL